MLGCADDTQQVAQSHEGNNCTASDTQLVTGPDTDADGVPDSIDNCPMVANHDQSNVDGDAFGDACDNDADGDGVLNVADNCVLVLNPSQKDTDKDATGDACDSDRDGDKVPNDLDDCPDVAGRVRLERGVVADGETKRIA